MVSTLDSESSDPSSNLGRTCNFFLVIVVVQYHYTTGGHFQPLRFECTVIIDDIEEKKYCARCGARTHDPGITRALVVSV